MEFYLLISLTHHLKIIKNDKCPLSTRVFGYTIIKCDVIDFISGQKNDIIFWAISLFLALISKSLIHRLQNCISRSTIDVSKHLTNQLKVFTFSKLLFVKMKTGVPYYLLSHITCSYPITNKFPALYRIFLDKPLNKHKNVLL